jgi:hypothetical protein
MNRLLIATGAVTMLVVVACGSSSAAGVSTSTSSGASGGGAAGRNGTAGELVQINGNTLILNTQSGDVTVQTTSATTVQKTSTGSVADIVVGTCIGATGSKDASGAVTANSVRLSEKVGGTCNGGAFGGAPGGGGRGNGGADTRTPPAGSAQPTPPANFASLRGEVSAVAGTSVSVLSSTGVATTITVPTTVAVTRSATASLSDLSTGQCVLATGSKDSTGAVAARSLSIVPAGPSGCFTGRGGFRRGGAGGGAGGGGAGSSGSASVGA